MDGQHLGDSGGGWLTTIAVGVGTAVAAVIAAVARALHLKRKARREDEEAEVKCAAEEQSATSKRREAEHAYIYKQYRRAIEELRDRLADLQVQAQEAHDQHIRFASDNARLMAENQIVIKENGELRERLLALERKVGKEGNP